MRNIAALIVAGGRGSRFGADGPKQYEMLAGRPLLRHAIEAFLASPQTGRICCVIHADDHDLYRQATDELPVSGVANGTLLPPVTGGATRQASVCHGLKALAATGQPPDLVLIHDAARPLLPLPVIERVLTALDSAKGAIPALPVADTLKRASADGEIAETVPRDHLWRAQTPQGFCFAGILAAHRQATHDNFTDDADLLQAAGHAVSIVPGDDSLLKVTTMADLASLEMRLTAHMETRTGFGYDVHAFGPGSHVTLGGISIPHTKGLTGHSDADVGLHALCDAIYGALADGDIGSHFPPSEAEWRGADSAQFLEHAAGLVRQRGGAIQHLDLTMVCERPKIGPHRETIRARIAEIAALPVHRVAVKATTSEKLGFTGREEGIAAHAVATLRLPVPDSE
jgi:2-C-methyl-D-erythritol 4-phosphate cytidylyltransferase/2-C-methyl-D-erythritol 2,4-cyclodiphosphate synthase